MWPCSALTKKQPSRHWIASIQCCPCLRDVPSAMDSSTTGTALYLYMRALDVKTGEVHGKTARRHTSADFVAFLNEIVKKTPEGKDIHIVLDNLSAHKTQAVRDFLEGHPKIQFHFTPTYSSWLNQVELWFAKIQRDVIARGVFTSVTDLSRKLMKYIRAYAKTARPFRWTYTDPSRRIRVTE